MEINLFARMTNVIIWLHSWLQNMADTSKSSTISLVFVVDDYVYNRSFASHLLSLKYFPAKNLTGAEFWSFTQLISVIVLLIEFR